MHIVRTHATIEELIEYRRSQEPPEEKAARLRKQVERLAEMDKRCHKIFQDSIPSEALLNKVISL
jgi:ppGpp synthetase/RelA/SpoT-type nucleotidyltranferase